MSSKQRPEHCGPADIFYNDEEAKKYTNNSRMIQIQTEMTERAIELLNLPPDQPCLLLDVGCGSGLSGECLTELGHNWIGIDISHSMLKVAVEREVEGDTILTDMGEGVCFRPGMFDGVLSISALQWLCNADKKSHHPVKRLHHFFSTLYAAMQRGSRAVFQIYPENPQQLEMITTQAIKAGFGGGVVVDYPNSAKAKKIFLCLFCGVTSFTLPKAHGDVKGAHETRKIQYSQRNNQFTKTQKSLKKSRNWIEDKKERRKRQGKDARQTTKYSGRKRKARF